MKNTKKHKDGTGWKKGLGPYSRSAPKLSGGFGPLPDRDRRPTVDANTMANRGFAHELKPPKG